jgi:16S rRNA (cytosine1402-N4)-methyltransferase
MKCRPSGVINGIFFVSILTITISERGLFFNFMVESDRNMHIPVLKNEIVECFEYLKKIDAPVFVDGTLGAGGHSLAIAQSQNDNAKIRFIGIDQDENAIKLAKGNIKKSEGSGSFDLVHDNFKNIKDILEEIKIKNVDGILVDLGVSSMQLDQAERGFSFKDPEQPLDMRMDQTKKFDAKYIIGNYPEAKLEYIFREYGEEPFAKRIAKNICISRKIKKIEKVGDLLDVISTSIPGKMKYGRIHFATKTFQALRIEVNAELTKLDQAIYDFTDVLKTGGRLAVITFHSLEDRIIKHAFIKLADPCECPKQMPCICNKKATVKIVTRKPISSTAEEISLNARSRSAKLRILEKI